MFPSSCLVDSSAKLAQRPDVSKMPLAAYSTFRMCWPRATSSIIALTPIPANRSFEKPKYGLVCCRDICTTHWAHPIKVFSV